MKKTRTGYEVLAATVAEMSADPAVSPSNIDIPLDQDKLKVTSQTPG